MSSPRSNIPPCPSQATTAEGEHSALLDRQPPPPPQIRSDGSSVGGATLASTATGRAIPGGGEASRLLTAAVDFEATLGRLDAALAADPDTARALRVSAGISRVELQRLRSALCAYVDRTTVAIERTFRRLTRFQNDLRSGHMTADEVVRALRRLSESAPAGAAELAEIRDQLYALTRSCDATAAQGANAAVAAAAEGKVSPNKEIGAVLGGSALGGAAIGTWIAVEGGAVVVGATVFAGFALGLPVAVGVATVAGLGWLLYRVITHLRGRSGAKRSAMIRAAVADLESQRPVLAQLAADAETHFRQATEVNTLLADTLDGCEASPRHVADELRCAVLDLHETLGVVRSAQGSGAGAVATGEAGDPSTPPGPSSLSPSSRGPSCVVTMPSVYDHDERTPARSPTPSQSARSPST